jgi:hypothetical protein
MSCVEALPTFYACIAAAIIRMSVSWKVEEDWCIVYSQTLIVFESMSDITSAWEKGKHFYIFCWQCCEHRSSVVHVLLEEDSLTVPDFTCFSLVMTVMAFMLETVSFGRSLIRVKTFALTILWFDLWTKVMVDFYHITLWIFCFHRMFD